MLSRAKVGQAFPERIAVVCGRRPHADDSTSREGWVGQAMDGLVGDAIVVGCGRAAFFPSTGVRIINLKDGSSWFLGEPANGWTWATALALTCDELFVRTASTKGATITRVPLANLGPATPAD